MTSEGFYCQKIAEKLGVTSDRIFLFWKGRVALYTLLKSMGIGKGDEVILPAFTCVVVPNAIIYLGAMPVYIDIDSETYNPSLSSIKKAVTDKTRVILCQNTFGLSSQVDEIANMAHNKGIFTIEDCTHGFGGKFKGLPNGSFCDAAFFSTQWNKPFSTGIGGFASAKNQQVFEKMLAFQDRLGAPSLMEQLSIKIQLFARQHLLTQGNYWRMLRFYRWLSKHNLVTGSSGGQELSGIEMPDRYFVRQCGVQIKSGVKNIAHLDHLLELRKRNALIYSEFLQRNAKVYVNETLFGNHSFLKYPLLVKNRSRFEQLAEKNQIALGDWFNSPLHPVKGDLGLWKMEKRHFPNAVNIAARIVNLPTDLEKVDRVIMFLEKNLELIE